MASKKVIKNLEAAINRICDDIKDKKGGSGADKLDSLSKLVNSYSRLIERGKEKKIDTHMNGDPGYYERIAAQEKKSRKGITR
jgi:hypothetical protein